MDLHTGAVALTTRLLLFCTLPHLEPPVSIRPTERHTESVSPTNPFYMHHSIPASTHTMTIDIVFTGKPRLGCSARQLLLPQTQRQPPLVLLAPQLLCRWTPLAAALTSLAVTAATEEFHVV